MNTQTLIALNLFTSLFANCFKTCLAANPKEQSPWRIGFLNPISKSNILAFVILGVCMLLLQIPVFYSQYFPPIWCLILFKLIYLTEEVSVTIYFYLYFKPKDTTHWELALQHCPCYVDSQVVVVVPVCRGDKMKNKEIGCFSRCA